MLGAPLPHFTPSPARLAVFWNNWGFFETAFIPTGTDSESSFFWFFFTCAPCAVFMWQWTCNFVNGYAFTSEIVPKITLPLIIVVLGAVSLFENNASTFITHS
jgi:hypothetical protein